MDFLAILSSSGWLSPRWERRRWATLEVTRYVDLKNRLDPNARLGLRLTLIVFAFVLVAVPFAFLLLEVVFKGPLTVRDQQLANDLNRYNLREDDGAEVARLITQLGSTVALIVIVLTATVWLAVFRKRRRQALFLVVTSTLGLVLNNLIKHLVGRARPHFDQGGATAIGSSFPSGHAMNSTVVYGCLLVIIWPMLPTTRARAVAFTSRVLCGAGDRDHACRVDGALPLRRRRRDRARRGFRARLYRCVHRMALRRRPSARRDRGRSCSRRADTDDTRPGQPRRAPTRFMADDRRLVVEFGRLRRPGN